MAGPNESNDDTVRVDLPLPTSAKTADQNIKQTVRVRLPVREPLGKAPPHTPTEPRPAAGSAAHDLASSQFSPPANPPSFSPPSSALVMPAPDSPASGLKKETLRVPLVSDPPASAGRMKNTPPPVPMPHVVPQNFLIAAELREKNSMLLLWILLGVSALILLIQIWIYLS
jgi:hypothetical protein